MKVELLAPAGDLERLKVNLLYGADAVYVGLNLLGLRANAINFTLEELKEGCLFAHQHHKKVYCTANIVFHEAERKQMKEVIEGAYQAGVDAFIVSDLYLMRYLKKYYPQTEVHVSTQNSVTNYQSAKFYQEMGADRIVLARELSLSEIQAIIEKTGVDVEVFIQGAMCTCYSGRCALSSYVQNRDPNRGGCSQVCRFTFDTDVDSSQKFTMATKDLNLARYVENLIKIGVKSFKIEGRMRSIYYLATVVGTYRKIIDAVYQNTVTDELIEESEALLNQVSNRESSSQFLLKEADRNDQYYTGRQEVSNQDYLGQVIGYEEEKKWLVIKERNYFQVGDKVELFTPEGETYSFSIQEIYQENGEKTMVARHPDEVLFIPFPKKVSAYSMIRIKKEKGGC